MICSACGHENPAAAKFCAECGGALARSCPSCGTALLEGAKFCVECGSATATVPPSAAVVSSAVRKRVTALFADLVGSTAFAERIDPETVRSTLAPYFEILQASIEDHAGTVAKFMGDGMLALFGVPEVAEDDALRAVTAGFELQRRFMSFADDVRTRHGVELGLRVGVNTGELVVGDDDADLVGDVLNTAARLEGACEPGRVLVGEDTWRLTRSHIGYAALGEVQVKGKSEPIAAFQVIDDEVAGGDAPFVGRGAEIEALRAVFDDAASSSVARLVTVVGAPGVGKTRLAQELRASCGARWFDVRFERRGSTTFSPIADLLREVTGSGSADGVERLVDGHPEAGRLGSVLRSLLGHGEPRTTEESFWGVRRLLELLAANEPVVLVVDDIQWAEPLFWDLLDHLVEWTHAPVLLLVLARPELRELRPELTQPGRRVSVAMALEGLDRDTTIELAARLLDIDVLPAELAERLPASTEGNPLFVRELVQMLVDDTVLVRDGDRWRLTIEAEAIEVPPTIISLLASRVERLPDDERQVVELAAVIGTEFDRGALAAIAPADLAGRLGVVIDRLRRKDLIEPSGHWAGDHPVYRFHHVLIRDAAYRRLLKARRAELHERVGRHVAMSGGAEETVVESDVVVAFHFEQFHRYRSELGTVDDHVRELAIDAANRLRSAAEHALGRDDLPSAGTYAVRALALVDAGAGQVRDDLLVIGCEALLSSGDVTRSAPLVDELRERSSDDRLAAWADCFRAQLWSLTDANRLTEAADLTAASADRLAALGDAAGVAKARLVRASCLARLGRVGDCEVELDLALGAARSAGDRRRTVAVLGAAPLAALWGPSPVARAGGRCLDVLRLLRITAPSPTVEAVSIRCQGVLEALRGRFDSARTKFEASRAIAQDLGLRHGLYETELFAGFAELLADDAAAAEPHLRAASDGLGRLGIGADAEQARALLARSLLLQGRTDEADKLASHALETAGQNLQTAITSRAVLAEIRAAQGRHWEARALTDEALAIVAPTDVTLDHALTLLAAARVASTAGDTSSGQRQRSRAAELLDAKGVTIELRAEHEVASAEATVPGASPQLRLWNEAVEIASRAGAAANATDRHRFVACFHPDVTSTDHGALADATGYSGRTGADNWADFMLFVMAQSDGSRLEIEPIAVRGGSHTLVRQTLQSPAVTFERLAVVVCDGGQIASIDWYDLDQLHEALGQLDRSYLLAQSLSPDHWLVQNWHRALATTWAELEQIVHDDVQVVDHRRTIGFDGARTYLVDTMRANDRSQQASVPRVLQVSDRGAVFEKVEVVPDQPGEVHYLLVVGFRDDRIGSLDVFEAGSVADESRALRRYDEVVAGRRGATNRASELFQQLFDAHVAGDTVRIERILPDDARVENRRRLATVEDLDGRAFREWIAQGRASGEVAPGGDGLVRAVRGDHLCLTNADVTYDGDLIQVVAVVECDDDRIRGLAWFDDDQLGDAVAELDRRWLGTCGVPADESIVQNWHYSRTNRMSDLAEIAHPNFQYVNHQRFRTGSGGDIDELVRRGWEETEVQAIITDVRRFDRTGAVYERVEIRDDDEISRVVVLELLDGLIKRFDIFDTEDLDEALALFDGRRSAATARRSDDPQHSNRAYRMAEALGRASVARARDQMLDLLADDFEFEQRSVSRAAMGVSIRVDRTEFAERLVEFHSGERVDGLQRELVATRGDDLYLATSMVRTEHGDELALLALGESEGTRLRRMTWYDESQLAEALAELDRRYRLSCGIDDDHWITRSWHVLYSVDFDDMEPVLHPDFEYVERRQLSWPDGGAGDWRDWFSDRELMEVTLPAMHRLGEHGLITVRRERVEAGDLGVIEVVLVNEAEDGRVRRVVSYGPDQLDAAIAEFDAFVARRTSSRTLTNTAWRLAEAAAAAWRVRDRDRLASLLADDFAGAPFDPVMMAISDDGSLSTSAYLDVILADDLAGTIEIEPIAVRGDDFCLQRTRITSPTGDLKERLLILECRDGRFSQWNFFAVDQLEAAQLELDRRWLSSLGFDDGDWLFRHWSHSYSMNPDEFVDLLHPDFEFVDHSVLALPSGDADTLTSVMRSIEHEVDVIIPQIHRVSRTGGVAERIERATGDLVAERHFVTVVRIDDDALRRFDVFALDDLDAAIALFDERERSVNARLIENQASALVLAVSASQQAGDRERFASLLADDFVAIAHDPIMATASGEGGVFDRTTYLTGAFDPLVFGPDSRYELETIAVRCDDLSLTRVRTTTVDGDVYERLNLVEIRDGLAVRHEAFPHDQLAEAQIALDHRYLEMLGYPEDHFLRRISSIGYTMDPAAFASMMHPDAEYVEHRRLSFTGGNGTALFDAMQTVSHDAVVTIPIIFRFDDHGAVVLRVETVQGEVAENRMIGVMGFQAGLYRHVELFDEADLGAALARYDEIVASAMLGNEASSLGDRMHELLTARDREGLAAESVSTDSAELGPLTNAAWEAVRSLDALDDVTGRHELVAVRTDEFCLTRFTGSTAVGEEIERLVVSSVIDGVVGRSITFGSDDLASALVRLEVDYADAVGGPGYADWMRRCDAAFTQGDEREVRALVTDDFESIDHRPIGLGRRTADEWAASIVPLIGQHRPVVTRVVRHAGRWWLTEVRNRSLVDDSEWHMLVLGEIDGERLCRWEVFDPDQIGGALERFDEMSTSR
jgi:class 3 adenylate cyclase/tetratricopeptide (TPR) repeat protein